MSKNGTMTSNITNPALSLLSQQQIAQNQLQLRQLSQQQQKQFQQQQQTKSFTSQRSQEILNNLRIASTSESNPKSKEHKDPRDPLSILIPVNADPTDVLAARFSSWRAIIRSLLVYFREIVSVHDEIVRQQIRLQHAITFPFPAKDLDGELYQPLPVSSQNGAAGKANEEFQMAQKFFLPLGNGSVQDLPSVLLQFHGSSALNAQSTSKELSQNIIPRLEDLRRDLLVKIKEIKSLQSDFKTTVGREQQLTKQDLSLFYSSVGLAKSNPSELLPKNDPYLLKQQLDRQIKKQLTEENFLHDAFNNLQGSGKELEKVVFMEVQSALTVYARLLGQEAQAVFENLVTKLDSGILTKEPQFEWEAFVSKDPNFVDPNLPMRKHTDIVYKNQFDSLTLEVRSGYLERKSKYLKSYSKGFYVLTPTFLHEFKSPDLKKDPVPVMSLSLNDCSIGEHSRKDTKNPNTWHKFVLQAQQNGIMHRAHNWVFRAESYDLMMAWYSDLKKLTALPTPQARANIAAERKKQQSLLSSSDKRKTQLSVITGEDITSGAASMRSRNSMTADTLLSIPKDNPDVPYLSDAPREVVDDAADSVNASTTNVPSAETSQL
ncbi:unnamed protein product [Kuraishia capsulata CBS 1993]|uniref:PH domain-containing protein n=1 Tax=Kuraishia capsulata CBS 1993 TaxID=1382522 RepID=W6MV96_9ASCO|nr:uncharacterized protein KUCA_T00002126001 [Kuraishia capsulata CBS 1993]CDK26155.1 unnamed protein product [Kuraishia capsulata CBS 1993]